MGGAMHHTTTQLPFSVQQKGRQGCGATLTEAPNKDFSVISIQRLHLVIDKTCQRAYWAPYILLVV
jgi:hypothetical protein